MAHNIRNGTLTNGIDAEYGSNNTGANDYRDNNDVDIMGVSKPSSLRQKLHSNNSASAKHVAVESTGHLHAKSHTMDQSKSTSVDSTPA